VLIITYIFILGSTDPCPLRHLCVYKLVKKKWKTTFSRAFFIVFTYLRSRYAHSIFVYGKTVRRTDILYRRKNSKPKRAGVSIRFRKRTHSVLTLTVTVDILMFGRISIVNRELCDVYRINLNIPTQNNTFILQFNSCDLVRLGYVQWRANLFPRRRRFQNEKKIFSGIAFRRWYDVVTLLIRQPPYLCKRLI